MEYSDLEDIAQCMFGFVPKWSRPTMDKILAICAKHNIDPAVYLRAFADNTKQASPIWHSANVILSEKWQDYIPEALKTLETEARVAYESDARNFISTLLIDGDPKAVLENSGLQMSAMGRVDFARKYRLSETEDQWMKSAMKEARANPCLAALYAFWQ